MLALSAFGSFGCGGSGGSDGGAGAAGTAASSGGAGLSGGAGATGTGGIVILTGAAGSGTGGSVTGSGGAAGKGGASGNGGAAGVGAAGNGGATGSGGAAGNGGAKGGGGAAGGGIAGNGGTTGGAGGAAGSGGATSTGGAPGCASEQHMCTSGCVMNTSVSTCGKTACSPCAVPANGSATCDGMSCGIMCDTNYHPCGSTCASNTDPAACGSSCIVCSGSSIANSAPTCNGTCGVGCAAGYRACTATSGLASCNRITYDFNDGSSQGWVAATTPTPPSAVTVMPSTTIMHGSSGSSLQIGGTFGVFGSGSSMGVQVPLCVNGSENLNGRTVSAWIYIASDLPDCSPSNNDIGIYLYSASSGNGTEVASAVPVVQTWFQVSATVTNASVLNDYQASILLTLNCTSDQSWPITLYVDDVTIGN